MSGLLKYVSKSASVPMMEATFNSDYDTLLSELELFAEEEAKKDYTAIFALLLSSGGLLDQSVRLEIRNTLFDLIQRIYRRSQTLYASWYMDSFGHMSSLSTGEAIASTTTYINTEATTRANQIVGGLINTIEKNITEDKEELSRAIEKLSKRVAVTESNASAGTIVQATAISAFSTATLFKRWVTVGDERVRQTHRLVSMRKPIPVNSLYRVGDTFMRFPADPQAFGGNVAAEVINCRCRSLVLPRTITQPNSFALNQFLIGN